MALYYLVNRMDGHVRFLSLLAEFKGLVAELTSAAKSFFFVLLGCWTDTSHMTEPAARAQPAAPSR